MSGDRRWRITVDIEHGPDSASPGELYTEVAWVMAPTAQLAARRLISLTTNNARVRRYEVKEEEA